MKAESKFALVMEGEEAEYETLWTVTVGGKRIEKKDLLELTVNSLKLLDGEGGTQFEMDRSSFRLCLQSGKPKIDRREQNTEFLKLSADDLDAIAAFAEDALPEAGESIGDALGIKLVHETVMPNVLSSIELSADASAYALDRTNGHLFVSFINGVVVMYDVTTMEELARLETDYIPEEMDADGGYLVCASKEKGQLIAYVYSSETMEMLDTVFYTNAIIF